MYESDDMIMRCDDDIGNPNDSEENQTIDHVLYSDEK